MNNITFNITLTGQVTVDGANLEQFVRGFQTQTPIPIQPVQPETPINSLPRLAYTVKETAEMLAVNDKTVYRLIERGLLKSSGALRHKRIPVKEIERFLKETTEN